MTPRELSPCPFCGPGRSQVDLYFDDVAQGYRVGCGRCGASTGVSPRDKTEAPAIERWNRRASTLSALAQGDVEGMAAELEKFQSVNWDSRGECSESIDWHDMARFVLAHTAAAVAKEREDTLEEAAKAAAGVHSEWEGDNPKPNLVAETCARTIRALRQEETKS